MKHYSSYKDSGIAWLGEIPAKWDSVRLKYIGFHYGGLSGKSGKDFNQDENPNNKPFIPFTNIAGNTYISKDNFGTVAIADAEEQNVVKQYDLFFLMSSETQEDVGKSSVLKEDIGEVYLNTFCRGFRITDEKNSPLFINYLLGGHSYRELLCVEGKGFTRINLRLNKINDLEIFLPPLPEQKQIVKFLDSKTQKIDKLIEKTEKKIELLNEKRVAIINHCVTKGLDPDVEMKDSGVEWIGEIPSHWKFPKLWLIISSSDLGGNYNCSSEYSGYPVMKMGNLGRGSIKLDKVEFIDNNSNLDENYLLQNGDFLFNTRNSRDLVGKVSLWRRELPISTFNSNILRICFYEDVLNHYMDYFFNSKSILDALKLISKGTTNVSAIYFKDLSKINICLPSKEEQSQIVEYLDEQTQKIDVTIEKETRRIELLKEYRQSLISEVVTGKIDVRSWKK